MGELKNLASGRSVRLPGHCLLGRTPFAVVRLEHAAASREHAVLEWNRTAWRVRDLGTRNGTFLNGRACPTDWQELVAGDELAFGAREDVWVLIEAGPPPPAAVADDGAIRLGRGDLLLLPGDEDPRISVQADGQDWVVDDGDRVVRVESGRQLEVAGSTWELLLPSGSAITSTANSARSSHLSSLSATFEFDRTEEHVRITLWDGEKSMVLPSRSFHHMLLVLGRTRIYDQKVRGLSEAEAGWIDSLELARMLGARPAKVNVDVFRARKLFAEHAIAGAAGIIERRFASRQLRLGLRDLDLVPL